MKLTFDKIKKDLETLKGSLTDINDKESPKVLVAEINATHYGYKNQNNSIYNADFAEANLSSFVKPFTKPQMLLHDGESKPIGRIIGFGSEPFTKVPEDNENLPVTIGKLLVRITDQDGIHSILNGEYVTCSISGKPAGPVYCTNCGTDLTNMTEGRKINPDAKEDEKLKTDCNHLTTKDGKSIPKEYTKISYRENSFVPFPADLSDEHVARIVAVSFEDNEDGLKGLLDKKWMTYDTKSKAIIDLTTKNYKEFIGSSVLPQIADAEMEPEEEKNQVKVPSVYEEYDFSGATEEELSELLLYLNSWEGLPDEEESESDSEPVEDKPLTAEKRNKMKTATFCGPNRSFPVNDCAHYTAALRLLNRYKGPGDKEKIRACIMSKGRKLGCTDSKDSIVDAIKDLEIQHIQNIQTILNENMNLSLKLKDTELKIKDTEQLLASCMDKNLEYEHTIKDQEKIIKDLNDQIEVLNAGTKEALIESIIQSKIALKTQDTQVLWATPTAEEATAVKESLIAKYNSYTIDFLKIYDTDLKELNPTIVPATEQPDTLAVSDVEQTSVGTKKSEVNSGSNKTSIRGVKPVNWLNRNK